MPGPLDGIKILEFTEIVAGPYSGMLLSDMGADVIKVEPPWGEPQRTSREMLPKESRYFIGLNRGKRSLPLDLTRAEGREILYRLVPETDAVIINARPDVPRSLGIDYETLSAKNPRLIYCEITAFGREGPDRNRPGYDIVVQAMTGLMASEGKVVDGVPQFIVSSALVDHAAGVSMAWGVCAALYHRERTGKGQKIEISLLGTALGLQTPRFTQVEETDEQSRADFLELLGQLRERGAGYEEINEYYRAETIWVGNIYYRAFQASDGVLAVGCLSDPLRKKLLDVLGLKDIRFEPGYDPESEEARVFGRRLVERAEQVFRGKTVDEWLGAFDEVGVPAGPLRFTEELVDDEQVKANNLVVDLEHSLAGKIKMFGPVLKMSQSPLKAQRASPALGEHTQEILKELGYSTEEIQRFKELKISG
ncbi:MAG: CoA transferase [SAR202 cluster bacterium]|nr:CoA transferase [SAR202 cluster bacterium]